MLKKYLTNFNNDNEYNDFIFSKELITPNVSLIKAINKINFGIKHNYEYTIEEIEELKNQFINCKFMYEDDNHNIILNFKDIDVTEVLSFNEYNFIPFLARHIGVYNNGIKIGNIDITSKLQPFEERKYRVGLMSDIHYNDNTIDNELGTYDDDGTQYEMDLPNSLSVYQNKEDVDFICAAGDVSTDSIRHILNFRKMLDAYAPTTNFYSCLGNHDFCAISNPSIISPEYSEIGFNVDDLNRLQAWNDILTPSNSKYEINFQDEDTEIGKTSYWFEVPIEGTNKSDIYLFLSVNYNNNDSTANQLLTEESPYIQELIDYVGFMPSKYNLQLYDNQTLLWFKSILEQFSNKRIFIFTHLFFVHKAGSNNIDNGYYHYGGMGDRWRMQEESAYCPCGIQFEFLNKLNNEYKNTIWFTGHSHYKWNWQTVDPHVNINNNEYNIYRPDDNDFVEDMHYLRKSNESISKTGFNIHLPSTSRPLKINQWYDVAGGDSEGAIMDVYEDYIDIRGIVFKEGKDEYINKYYPLAQYRINIKAA